MVHTKGITDPKVTHGDRVVQSAAQLAADIGSFVGQNRKNDANMNDLKELTEITQRLAERNKSKAALPAPRVSETTSTPVTMIKTDKEELESRVKAAEKVAEDIESRMRAARQAARTAADVPEPRVPSIRTQRTTE